jgi:hypothetical protein
MKCIGLVSDVEVCRVSRSVSSESKLTFSFRICASTHYTKDPNLSKLHILIIASYCNYNIPQPQHVILYHPDPAVLWNEPPPRQMCLFTFYR